jgi:hypothetical protein
MTVYVQIEDGTIVCATIVKPTNLDGWEVREVASLADVKVGEHIPTQEEISQMRQTAYEAECDPYLVAYQGYLVEGDEAKAESARKAYLRAKAEVRKRLPYNE